MRLLAIPIVLLLGTTACRDATAGEGVRPSHRVDALLEGRVRDGGPGAAVMVVLDGAIVHQRGYGLADVTKRRPITAQTTFDLASVSKQFTAMAIMMLVERGELSYDDTLATFFPALPAYARRITVRHLLTHTSGVPDYMTAFEEKVAAVPPEPSSRDVITMIASRPEPEFVPGTRFGYSNSGYVLLAQIVEQVTDTSFPEFMKHDVFEPLGMHATLVSDSIRAPARNRAVSYDASWIFGWRYRDFDYTPLNRIYGDGNVNTSLEDMFAWVQALETEALVKRRTLAEAFQGALLVDGTTTDYGFGWRIAEQEGRRILQHGGSWAGFRSYVVRVPSERLTVVVLSNVTTFDAAEVARTVAGYYLDAGAAADGPAASAASIRARSAAPIHRPLTITPLMRSELPIASSGLASRSSRSARAPGRTTPALPASPMNFATSTVPVRSAW